MAAAGVSRATRIAPGAKCRSFARARLRCRGAGRRERMTDTLKISLAHWPEVSAAVFVPHTAAEYERLVALLDELVDEVGNDESHPWSRSWKSSACSSRNT